jgi:hypothetical protein
MSALIRLFWSICIFQRGPQDVPYSPFLFGGALLINILFGLFALMIPDYHGATQPLARVIFFLVVATLISVGFVIMVLWVHGHVSRSLQTLTTMLAADTITGLAQIPFSLLVSVAGNNGALVLLFYLGMMAALMWQLAVYTHIFRHALSVSVFRGGAYALVLFILSLMIQAQMLPVTK